MRVCEVDKATAYAKLDQMETMENLIEHGSSVRWAWPVHERRPPTT